MGVMNQPRDLVIFLALSAFEQRERLPGIPRDRSVADFHTGFERNPLWIAVRNLREALNRDDRVPYEEWLESTGLPEDWDSTALAELSCLLHLLTAQLDWQNLFTQRSLETKPDWRLVRRLARASLVELGWVR
jgi:hypothetical protein